MQAIEYLKQLRSYETIIKNKMFERERWKALAYGTTAHSDGERVQASSNQQKMADAVVKYIEIEQEIGRYIDRLCDKRKGIMDTIALLDVDEYDVLHQIYVQYKSMKEVAMDLDRSTSWVKHIRKNAINNLQKILDEREKHG